MAPWNDCGFSLFLYRKTSFLGPVVFGTVCVLEVYGIVITFCFVNEPCFCSELFLIVSLKAGGTGWISNQVRNWYIIQHGFICPPRPDLLCLNNA
jgi:hypothetical protein